MRSTLGPLLLAIALLVPADAMAEECGNVTNAGTCLDSKTLVWCDAGELRTQVCPTSEICVADPRFQGGYGCIATQYTSCGGLTAAGECANGDQVVVWCDVSRVRVRECGLGLTCAWVEADAGYDCVPVATRPDPEADATSGSDATDSSDADTSEPGADSAEPVDAVMGDGTGAADVGPSPTVEKGGAGPASNYAAGGGGGTGCQGGDLTPSMLLAGLLGGLALLVTRRRSQRAASHR